MIKFLPLLITSLVFASPLQKYNRKEQFGTWKDFDGNCQSAREELLIREGEKVILNKSGCNVVFGTWYLPYNNEVYTGNDAVLHADHIVPLSFAWKHGANKWTQEKREAFANDLENLIISNSEINIQKSDKGINEWLPPHKEYQCEYVARFMYIVNKYKLENVENYTHCQ